MITTKISDFSIGLTLWQAFQLVLLAFLIYFIYTVFKYVRRKKD